MATVAEPFAQAVDPQRLTKYLAWFAGVRRDTGGPGEDRAAAYIADTLQAEGVPVTTHEFDAFLSYPIRATLEVQAPERRTLRCLTHSFVRSTGPDGIIADLVYLEDGDVSRGAGRAALIDGLAAPVTILRASRAGCTAAVFANQDRVIHNLIGTTIWGTPGLDQLDRLPQIPAVSVNRESGEWLKALLKRGETVRVRVVTEVNTGWVVSKLPEVRIPARGGAEEFVLVGGHYCSWDVGITDNATGDAGLMEIARVLWAQRAGLERGIRVCWWPGHSHGRYAGSAWYADTFFTDLAEHCVAYHNIDSPGVKNATRYIARHTSAEMEEFCRGIIARMTGQQSAPVHRPSRAADQSFLANGVPAFSTYPFLPEDHPDYRAWTGGSANAWWWHSELDTLDKADVDILTLDTRISLAAVTDLANAEVLPISHVDTAAEIRDVLRALAEKVGTHFDFGPALREADAFAAQAERLEGAKPEARGASAAGVNRTLMRLSRILNPVIYSQQGRFHHDPAEWSPIMRATSRYTLSAIGKAAGLPQLAGQQEYGFLKAQVRWEANRLVTALREATALIASTLEAGG